MRKIKYYCDICGIESDNVGINELVVRTYGGHYDIKKDLCIDCRHNLERWLKRKRKGKKGKIPPLPW